MSWYKTEIWLEYPTSTDSWVRWAVYKRHLSSVFNGPVKDELITEGKAEYRWSARWKARRAAKRHARGYDFTDEQRQVKVFHI